MTKPIPPLLPPGGLSRWRQIKPFVPFTQETWRKLVIAGKAPQPVKMGIRCTFWKNDEVIAFLANIPLYRAVKDKTPSTARTGG